MAVYTAIDDSSAHFQTLLYTGDGGSDRTINFGGNSDLEPDFLWVKKRSGTQNHYLANTNDSISKVMYTNTTGVEANETSQFKSVHSDGWVQGSDNTNTNTSTFVAWGWKANGGTRTTFNESGNNPGGGYQANTTAGFSIIDYTGTGAEGDVQHGLGVIPDMIIIKGRTDSGTQWLTWHKDLVDAFANDGAYIYLNTTGQDGTTTAFYEGDAISSSVVAFRGGNSNNNQDAKAYIMYCFNSVQGYSKFSSYKGNGSADGPFVYTGFKPAFVMIKCTSQDENWFIVDTKRSVDNPTLEALIPNQDAAENTTTGYSIDILSNGFKSRNDAGQQNESGGRYIYMAFAEQPLVTSTGIPATAR